MPVNISLKITNLPEISAILRNHIPDAFREGSSVGIIQGGERVVDRAKTKVPVKTGRLQRSIAILSSSPQHVVVGSELGYAGLVEKGSSRRRPKPYMEPSVLELAPEIQSIIHNEIIVRLP